MTKQRTFFYAEKFSFKENKEAENSKFVISGLAMPFEKVSRNGVRYEKTSSINAAPSMVGAPVLINHDETILPVGHVIKFEQGKIGEQEGLIYEMDIDPAEIDLIRKLQRGDISKVSIHAFVDESRTEGDTVYIEDFAELSIVSIPGFPQTNTTIGTIQNAGKYAVAIEKLCFNKTEKRNGDNMKKEDANIEQEQPAGNEQVQRIAKVEEAMAQIISRIEAIETMLETDEEVDGEKPTEEPDKDKPTEAAKPQKKPEEDKQPEVKMPESKQKVASEYTSAISYSELVKSAKLTAGGNYNVH